MDGALLLSSPVESQSRIVGIGSLLNEALKDLPRRTLELGRPAVIPAGFHEPDKASLPV